MESDAEERMRALARKAGLPSPLVNVSLHGFEVDFYWPAHGVVVEIDSYGFHTSRGPTSATAARMRCCAHTGCRRCASAAVRFLTSR